MPNVFGVGESVTNLSVGEGVVFPLDDVGLDVPTGAECGLSVDAVGFELVLSNVLGIGASVTGLSVGVKVGSLVLDAVSVGRLVDNEVGFVVDDLGVGASVATEVGLLVDLVKVGLTVLKKVGSSVMSVGWDVWIVDGVGCMEIVGLL